MKNDEIIDFKQTLYLEAKKHGFELNNNVLNNLEIYKKLLVEWNEKMNLTSIVEDYQIIVKHFVDCLECTKYINEKNNLIDVGTGAGFPGIVIAIYFEGKVNITLLDALNKRLIFLQEVVKTLELKNIKILHGRAEDTANNLIYRENYDIAVARAVAPLNILCEYTSPYIKVKGKCILMKADSIGEEIDKCKNAFKILNLKILNKYEYNLEIIENDNLEIFSRNILEIEKNAKTPKNYPRSYAKIKKMPL